MLDCGFRVSETVTLRYVDFGFKKGTVTIKSPAMRFKSGDLKTETMLLAFFLLTGTACRPLFKQGFWASVNSALGTLKHTNNEFMACDQLSERLPTLLSPGSITTIPPLFTLQNQRQNKLLNGYA